MSEKISNIIMITHKPIDNVSCKIFDRQKMEQIIMLAKKIYCFTHIYIKQI